jgi:copper chaperone
MAMKSEMFQVKGLNSSADADKILEALHHVWGVRRAEVNENTGNARISYDENAASLHDFEQAITEAGYIAEHVQGGDSSESM